MIDAVGGRERGSASVLVVAVAGVLLLVLGTVLGVGLIEVAGRRAAAAADLTALGAAWDGPSCDRAAALAHANGARLLGCRAGAAQDVTVQVAVPVRLIGPVPWATVAGTSRAGRYDVPVGAVSARAAGP